MLFKQGSDELVVKPDHFVQKLRILDVVALLVAVVGEGSGDHLLVSDVLEVQEFTLVLVVVIVEATASVGGLREESCLA